MALLVSKLCLRCVTTYSRFILPCTMKSTQKVISNRRLSFWSLSNTCSQLISNIITSPSFQTSFLFDAIIGEDRFVGVPGIRDCNQYKIPARVTKKNTRTTNPGVLDAVCYHQLDTNTPTIARCIDKVNDFTRCYV